MFSLQELSKKFIQFHKLNFVCSQSEKQYEIAVFQSIFDVPFEHWNRLVGEDKLMLSVPYLASLEAMPVQNMVYHYALVYENTLPIAGFYFQEFDYHLSDMNANVETQKLNGSLTLFEKVKGVMTSGFKNINLRLLVAGNAYISGEYGFALAENFDRNIFALLLDKTVQKIIQTQKSGTKIQGVLVKDYSQSSTDIQHSFSQSDYFRFTVDPNMELIIPLEVNSFDALSELFSSKYRVRAKSCVKKFQGIDSRLLSLHDIVMFEQQIRNLFKNVEEKAGFNLLTSPPNYFTELKKNLEEAFSFRAYFINDQMVGFATAFIWKVKLEAHFVGIDYAINQEKGLYQNMLYDYFNLACLHGIKHLSLGRTALEIKSTLGAEPDNMALYVKSTNPLFNKLVPAIFGNLKQTEWVQRKPFKNQEQAAETIANE